MLAATINDQPTTQNNDNNNHHHDHNYRYWFYHNYTTSLNQSAGTADPHFSMWGEIRGYGLIYAGAWAAGCLILQVLIICIHSTKQSFHAHRCWQAPSLQRGLQWTLYVLYLPFAIALLRPFACEYSEFYGVTVMDHDTSQVRRSVCRLSASLLLPLLRRVLPPRLWLCVSAAAAAAAAAADSPG